MMNEDEAKRIEDICIRLWHPSTKKYIEYQGNVFLCELYEKEGKRFARANCSEIHSKTLAIPDSIDGYPLYRLDLNLVDHQIDRIVLGRNLVKLTAGVDDGNSDSICATPSLNRTATIEGNKENLFVGKSELKESIPSNPTNDCYVYPLNQDISNQPAARMAARKNVSYFEGAHTRIRALDLKLVVSDLKEVVIPKGFQGSEDLALRAIRLLPYSKCATKTTDEDSLFQITDDYVLSGDGKELLILRTRESVKIPEGVEIIRTGAISAKFKTTSTITWPSTLKRIDHNAIGNVSNFIKHNSFPDTLEYVSDTTFSRWGTDGDKYPAHISYDTLYMKDNVKEFSDTLSLSCGDAVPNKYFKIKDNALLTADGTCLVKAFIKDKRRKHIIFIVPRGVKRIRSSAFDRSIETIVLWEDNEEIRSKFGGKVKIIVRGSGKRASEK